MDFSPRATAEQSKSLTQIPDAFAAELLRVKNGIGAKNRQTIMRGMEHEIRRTKHIASQLQDAVTSELERHPHDLDRLLPTGNSLRQDISNDLSNAVRILGPSQHALREISDRVHRTDHKDQRPELTLWQRIWRRLAF
jgi:hypothetical protein